MCKVVYAVLLTRFPLSIHFHRIWGQKMKFTKWKKWQKLMQGLYPNHMHISSPWRKHVESFKKIGIKLYEELCSQGTHFHRIWDQKMTNFTKWKKRPKLKQGSYPNHMHIFRPWRKHVQSFKKLYEELRSRGTHCLYIEVKKRLSSQSGKCNKK